MDQAIKITPLPVKNTESLDYQKKLGNFIKKQYGDEVEKEFESKISLLQKKREDLCGIKDFTDSTKQDFLEYALHAEFINTHFPINVGDQRVKLSFTWYDAFSKRKVTQGNANFDVANCLWNAAAVGTHVACQETRKNPTSCMDAAKGFQWCAGVFHFIRENIIGRLTEKITCDLSGEALECLEMFMLANAQQCVLENAYRKGMKKASIARLAIECAHLFKECSQQMKASTVKECFSGQMVNIASFKALYFEAYAHLSEAIGLYETNDVGKSLAKYHHASDLLGSIKNKPSKSLKKSLDLLQKFLKNKENEAEDDNQKVYHEVVPKISSFPEIKGARLAKVTPQDSLANLAPNVEDPFRKLFPVHIMEYCQRFSQEVTNMINTTFKESRTHRELLRGNLTQQGLPGSVMADDTSTQGFPKEVHEKIAKIQQNGGVSKLQELRNTLKDMATECHKTCQSVLNKIQKEENEDLEMRRKFGVKWNRLPSGQLNTGLKKQLSEAQSKIAMASKADEKIDGKLSQNDPYFKRFSLSPQELDRLMPQTDSSNPSAASQTAAKLKDLIDRLEKNFTFEEKMEEKIKQILEKADLKEKFLGASDVETEYQKAVANYKKQLDKVEDCRKNEESLMQEILTQNNIYVQQKQNSGQTPSKRAQAIQGMFYGINKYDEIMGNVQQGLNFYCTMQDFVKKVKQRVEDFILSRNMEKEDMLVNCQKEFTQPQAFTQAPQYQQYQNQPQQQYQPQQNQQYNYNNQQQQYQQNQQYNNNQYIQRNGENFPRPNMGYQGYNMNQQYNQQPQQGGFNNYQQQGYYNNQQQGYNNQYRRN